MTIKCIAFYVIAVAFVGRVTTRLFFSDGPKVQSTYQDTATVKFYSNFSAYPNYAFKTIYVEVRPGTDKEETVAAGGEKAFANQASKQFGNRLNAVVYPETSTLLKVFTLFISNVNFDDNVKLKATVVYREGSNPTMKEATAVTELEVLGGPLNCFGKLPDVSNIDGAGTSTINITICGKPLPVVTWSMGNKTFTTVSHEEVGAAKYKFILTLSEVTSSMCGKDISFLAKGNSGTDIQGKTKLNVIFNPTVTINLNYRVNSSCVHLGWTKLDIGTCTGLMYQIQYLNQSGSPIATTNHSQVHSEYTHCVDDISVIKDTRIRGVLNGKAGVWEGKVVSLVPPTSATTPSSQKSANTGDDDDWKTGAIVGGVLGGILLIVIIVIIICCCCCTWCLVCCGCKEKEDKEQPMDSKTNSFGFHYKRNSKPKSEAVVVVDGAPPPSQVYIVESAPPPTESVRPVIYATTQKGKVEADTTEPQFFDPTEFGLEPERTAQIASHYSNTTYVDDDNEDFSNKPSMLI